MRFPIKHGLSRVPPHDRYERALPTFYILLSTRYERALPDADAFTWWRESVGQSSVGASAG